MDDVRFGCVYDSPDSCNVARTAWLMAGYPAETPGVTLNRVCISGMEAVLSGAAMIQAGMAQVILAGGVEHMSGIPYSAPGARWGLRMNHQTLQDDLVHGLHCGSHRLPLPQDGPLDAAVPPYSDFVGKPYMMGHTAEFVAQLMDISREDMDQVALMSNHRAEAATNQGSFAREIVPIEAPRPKGEPLVFERDEQFRPGISLAELQRLRPIFADRKVGKVTAGNSSSINDGAAALLIMSAERAKELGLSPLARIRAKRAGRLPPRRHGPFPPARGEAPAAKLRPGIKDFGLVELNEAFAAQYLACERELGLDRDITNVNGSGIGLGHPVGATGARIMVTLLYAMEQRGAELGLATLCGGGGVSLACALERE